jgi:hypothetical protein
MTDGTETNTTEAQRRADAAYYARQRARGIRRRSVYVPDADAGEFDKAMRILKERWRRMGLID